MEMVVLIMEKRLCTVKNDEHNDDLVLVVVCDDCNSESCSCNRCSYEMTKTVDPLIEN